MQLLFAPGAGAPSTSPWMIRFRGLLGELGRVSRFDYPYMRGKKRGRPDPHDVLVAAHRTAFDRVVGARTDAREPIILAGKSMGSRIGCHLAVELERTRAPVRPAALICFGYPLVSAGKKKAIRDEVLFALRTPVIFVQGTRDEMCPLPMLEKVRAKMLAPNQLIVIETGDHSLECTKSHLREQRASQDDVERGILTSIRALLPALTNA